MAYKKREERKEIMRAFSYLSQIGVTIAACILIGVLFGKFLDKFFGTSPWLLLAFSLLGALAAFKTILDMTNRD